jgi:hypothetical protein
LIFYVIPNREKGRFCDNVLRLNYASFLVLCHFEREKSNRYKIKKKVTCTLGPVIKYVGIRLNIKGMGGGNGDVRTEQVNSYVDMES